MPRRAPVRRLLPIIKAAVSLGLLAAILSGIDHQALWARLSPLVALAGLGALALLQVQALGAALRWRLVLGALGQTLPLGTAWRNVLLGLFLNQALPSTIGGDGARVWNAWRLGLPLGPAARSLVVDRVFSFLGLILLAAAGLPVLAAKAQDPLVARGLATLVLGGLACLGVLFALRFVPDRPWGWRPAEVARVQAVALSRAAWAVLARGGKSLAVLVLMLVPHVLDVSVVWLYARALGVDVGWLHMALVVPPAVLTAAIPVSIAGWGLREGAMVLGFGLIGLPGEVALACSLLYGVSAVATGVLGGGIWALADPDGLAALRRRAQDPDWKTAEEAGTLPGAHPPPTEGAPQS